jgi:oxygen-independent coproporphyrinogen-3 oxidase
MKAAICTESLDFQRIAAAVGPAPGAAYAAAHAYPASAPMYSECRCAERDRPTGDVLRLYVHIPYCNYRCTFCFFAVRVGAARDEMTRYISALRRELEWAEAGTPLSQLFVGGGTPTALPPDLLDALLGATFEHLPSHGRHVHVVEASPESITAEHVEVLQRRGIGRVSMGAQSLHEDVLSAVHRRHSADQTLAACDLVVGRGLILNIDLMYGLPTQTEESFRRDFAAIAGRGVQSVTVYDLRLNEQTPVARTVADAERLELERLVRWRLYVKQTAAEFGFSQTRWHTFKRLDTIAAKHEHAPHHNRAGRGYQLGIGMSARSHLGTNVYRNHERIPQYLERVESGRSPVEHVIRLGEDDCRTQYVASTLGDGNPLDSSDYKRVFGTAFADDFAEPLGRLRDGGLIEEDKGVICLSEIGRLVHDRVTYNFYPERVLRWLSSRRSSRH